MRDRLKCFLFGHVVSEWGTLFGWCERCEHTISARDGRSILYYGKFYRYPPKKRS